MQIFTLHFFEAVYVCLFSMLLKTRFFLDMWFSFCFSTFMLQKFQSALSPIFVKHIPILSIVQNAKTVSDALFSCRFLANQ